MPGSPISWWYLLGARSCGFQDGGTTLARGAGAGGSCWGALGSLEVLGVVVAPWGQFPLCPLRGLPGRSWGCAGTLPPPPPPPHPSLGPSCIPLSPLEGMQPQVPAGSHAPEVPKHHVVWGQALEGFIGSGVATWGSPPEPGFTVVGSQHPKTSLSFPLRGLRVGLGAASCRACGGWSPSGNPRSCGAAGRKGGTLSQNVTEVLPRPPALLKPGLEQPGPANPQLSTQLLLLAIPRRPCPCQTPVKLL